MFICMCNPFTDRDVEDFLAKRFRKTSVSEVYAGCSSGNAPNCGKCIPHLRETVKEHNSLVTVATLGHALPVIAGTKENA